MWLNYIWKDFSIVHKGGYPKTVCTINKCIKPAEGVICATKEGVGGTGPATPSSQPRFSNHLGKYMWRSQKDPSGFSICSFL